MKRLFIYLRPFKSSFLWTSLWSITNKILDLMPPLLVAWVIDTVRGTPPNWISWFTASKEATYIAAFLAILSLVIFGLESFFQWRYQYGFMSLAQRVQHALRMDTYDKVQHREIAFFENHRLGDTLSILSDDINQLERFLNTGFNHLLQLVVTIIFAMSILFATSWQLALYGLIPIPFIVFGSFIYQSKIAPRYKRVREAVGALNSRIENNISGIMVIKSFTAERFEYSRVNAASKDYRDRNLHAISLHSRYVPMIRIAVSIGFAGVLLLGSYWILNGYGYLTIGELVLFSMLIQRVLWPMTTLGEAFDEYERAKASCKRVFDLLESKKEIADPLTPIPVETVSGNIELKQVEFKYPIGPPVIQNLSFSVKAGHTIGVAGATGAGKSTLIKLLLRLYDPSQGNIMIDGISIQDMSQTDLRHKIALVSQDVYLFYGSIFENIAYGMENASLDKVIQAAKSAEFHGFVDSLPDKYDTIVGERGIKLSGGQRQRLSIARAILKNAPIMIFDEATSSVDTETEKEIKQNLDTLTKGKTAIIIAHRLSTIRNADRILVLANGAVAEDGHHDDLIAKNGIYADLWNTQVGII